MALRPTRSPRSLCALTRSQHTPPQLLESLESRLLLSAIHASPASFLQKAPLPGFPTSTLKNSSHTNATQKSSHTNTLLKTFQPDATSPPGAALTPAQVRAAYGVDQVNFGAISGDGTGQTVAIIDAYHYPSAFSDLNAFSTQFGLPTLQSYSSTGNSAPYFRVVNQSGGTTPPPTDPAGPGLKSWSVESALDIEWVHAIAPGANIILVEANDNLNNNLLTAAVGWAKTEPSVTAISMSFSQAESGTETSLDSLFTTPSGHAGITYFAATGDAGQPSGYPAFSPNVVAVGGTTLNVSDNTYLSESAWSGSGGSVSTVEAQPSYQTGVVTQSSTNRANPDVAMDADPNTGVPVYDSYDFAGSPWQQFGGTSLATPMWAGIMAIINQGRVLNGLTSLNGRSGTLPKLYALPSSDFHDITTGSNGLPATTGYDLVTGRGTPIANLLIQDMVIPPTASTGTPDLLPISDTGFSNSDNITSLNNASPATQLQFSIPNTLPGATVSLYADGTLLASTVASDTTTTLTTNGSFALSSGSHAFAATQTQPGLGISALSSPLSVTIDTTSPFVSSSSPVGTVAGTQSTLRLTFNESIDLSSFSLADITTFTGPNNINLLPAITGTVWSANNTILDIQFSPQSAVGTYQLSLGTQLLDLAGNSMAAPYTATFTVVTAVYVATMDSNPNWTFDAGSAWAWGQPTGQGSHNLDPTSGHTGTNVMGYNLSGDYSRNSTFYATSPALDFSQYQNLSLSFWRWLGVRATAVASVQASPDGGSTWTTLWSNNSSTITDTAWTQQQLTLPSTFNGKSNVRIRFAMGPTGNSTTTYPGWNIDDLVIIGAPLSLPSINGQVFIDANANATLDPTETGIPNATVFLDLNNNGILDSGSGTFAIPSSNVPLAIPDNNPTGVTSTLSASAPGLISNLTITFNISHTFDSDLTAYLIGPDNTTITLFSGVGGRNDNFTNTTLSDSASTSITSAGAPFSGTFKPSPGTLSSFQGKSATGLWKFKVVDGAAQDTGTINSWSLNFSTLSEPMTTTDANGNYSFSVSPGTYTIREILPATYIPISPMVRSINVSSATSGQDFALFPTIFSSDTTSYSLALDPSSTILQIAATDPTLAPTSYQVPLSLLPALTFNLTGLNQFFTADFTNGTPFPTAGLTLNATRGNNTSLTLIGQTNMQTFTMTDFTFGPDATPTILAFNNIDNLTLSNLTANYAGRFTTILTLNIDNNSILNWS